RDLLYVGGSFDSCGSNYTPIAGFASWDGSTWTNLTGGAHTYGGDWTYCITKYDGHIYHGMRENAGALGNVFKERQADSNKIVQMNGSVLCMTVYNDQLYIGGIFTHIVEGGSKSVKYNGIARWDGINWYQVGNGIKAFSDSAAVKAMFVWNGNLYVGG